MNDIVIPAKSIRREPWVFVACVVAALLINVGAIIAYKTQWIELATTWHITLGVALVLYFLTGISRIGRLVYGSMFNKTKSNKQ